jgi:hypothetical protein
LHQVAKARGYKRAWVKYALKKPYETTRSSQMRLNHAAIERNGTDVECVPLILIDANGEPCMAIVQKTEVFDAETEWLVQFTPSECSAINSLIGRWRDEIGAKMREWWDKHYQAVERAVQRLGRR